MRNQDSPGDDALRGRLTSLADAIGVPPSTASPDPDADVMTAMPTVDRLVGRLTNLTAELRCRSCALDDLDLVTARLVLSDLAVLTATWQTLGRGLRHKLDSALADLHEAKRATEHIVQEPEE